MSWYIVLRPFLGDNVQRSRGRAVETTDWIHTERLVTQRYIRPATAQELAQHEDIVGIHVAHVEPPEEPETTPEEDGSDTEDDEDGEDDEDIGPEARTSTASPVRQAKQFVARRRGGKRR